MRSNRAEVRNPLLAMPAMGRFARLDPAAQEAVLALLSDIALDAGDRAERCWLSKKGPMAAYWKAVSVYAKHARAAVRRRPPVVETATPDPNQPVLL